MRKEVKLREKNSHFILSFALMTRLTADTDLSKFILYYLIALESRELDGLVPKLEGSVPNSENIQYLIIEFTYKGTEIKDYDIDAAYKDVMASFSLPYGLLSDFCRSALHHLSHCCVDMSGLREQRFRAHTPFLQPEQREKIYDSAYVAARYSSLAEARSHKNETQTSVCLIVEYGLWQFRNLSPMCYEFLTKPGEIFNCALNYLTVFDLRIFSSCWDEQFEKTGGTHLAEQLKAGTLSLSDLTFESLQDKKFSCFGIRIPVGHRLQKLYMLSMLFSIRKETNNFTNMKTEHWDRLYQYENSRSLLGRFYHYKDGKPPVRVFSHNSHANTDFVFSRFGLEIYLTMNETSTYVKELDVIVKRGNEFMRTTTIATVLKDVGFLIPKNQKYHEYGIQVNFNTVKEAEIFREYLPSEFQEYVEFSHEDSQVVFIFTKTKLQQGPIGRDKIIELMRLMDFEEEDITALLKLWEVKPIGESIYVARLDLICVPFAFLHEAEWNYKLLPKEWQRCVEINGPEWFQSKRVSDDEYRSFHEAYFLKPAPPKVIPASKRGLFPLPAPQKAPAGQESHKKQQSFSSEKAFK